MLWYHITIVIGIWATYDCDLNTMILLKYKEWHLALMNMPIALMR
jgi:hypothetical protein